MRNVQSRAAVLHKNLGKQHDLVFPLLLTAAQTDGSWGYPCKYHPYQAPMNTGFPSVTPVSFLLPTEVSPLSRGFCPYLWHILHLCLKREDLTQSCEARSCSKAAWAWEGGCFTATLQRISIHFPFPLWALIRFLWTSPNAGGVGNVGTLCPLCMSHKEKLHHRYPNMNTWESASALLCHHQHSQKNFG